MNSSPVIYGFGSACVDYRIRIPDMGDGYTAKVLAQEVGEFGGGACANCLVQAARLGAECTYLGKLGDDPQGKVIKSLLSSENINIELIENNEGTLSPFNVAVYKGKDNERVGGYLLPNSIGSITCKEAENLAGRMSSGSSVLVEIGEIPLESVLAFSKAALSKNVRIFIDVDLDPIKQLKAPLNLFEEILSLADVIIPNYDSMKSIFPKANHMHLAKAMSRKFNKTVIVTAGSGGVYFCEPEGITNHIAADNIEIADAVGAGDSFHGAFIYAIGMGLELDPAVRFAMKCAQKTCMGFGARTSMPYKKDIF